MKQILYKLINLTQLTLLQFIILTISIGESNSQSSFWNIAPGKMDFSSGGNPIFTPLPIGDVNQFANLYPSLTPATAYVYDGHAANYAQNVYYDAEGQIKWNCKKKVEY